MASQVSNWLYEKKDYAIKALTHWVGTIYVGETAAEVLQKLSKESSVRVYNSTLYNDDGDFELIVRPYSRTLGGDLGSKTGCMTFNISSSHQASINGLYGAIDLDNVIYQVFKACGVIVEEDKLNHYRLAVRDRMGIGALSYYTGVVIKVSNGLLIGYVSKKVVQNIINGMAEEGMFNVTQNPVVSIDYITEPGIYDIVSEPVLSEQLLFSVIKEAILRADYFYKNNNPGYLQRQPFDSQIHSIVNNLIAYMTEQNQTINVDYNTVHISVYPGTSTFDFRDYAIVCNVQKYTDIIRATSVSDMSQVGPYIQKYVTVVNGSPTWGALRADIGLYSDASRDFVGTFYPQSYYSLPQSIGWTYNTLGIAGTSTFNTTVVEEGPEGVTYEVGATIPTEESHNIGTVYPNWATTINQTVSPGLNISNRSLIALSFTGDTQYNTQAGVITTNEMLHRLGVYVEATEEYIPANPEEGEDGEPVVIIPDAKPIPSDTPNEDYPDSVTPASKYMVSVWNMTDTMVQNFASALWSNTLWNAIKDFFTKPTDGVIALFTLYGVDVGTGASSQEIKIGGHGTGVSAIPVTTRYKTVDLGTVNVPEFYSNVEDYAPYSSAEIFLPFIGFSTVDVNEIMNSTVNIKYVFDMWTGSLVARIFVTRDGIRQELYNFTGSASVQIPLTDRDYTSAISSLMLGAFDTAKNVVISGAIAAAAGATGGAALLPALGTGLIGGMNTLNNHTQGVKNRVQRSGSIGSIYGAMTNKKACIYVKRPIAYNANNYQHYYGFPANWTCTLRDCHGFTRVKDIHLDTVTCTDEERIEIERLLKQGVMM